MQHQLPTLIHSLVSGEEEAFRDFSPLHSQLDTEVSD